MEVDLDANNNSTDKKGYSLRPRCAPKTTEVEDIPEEPRKPRGRTQKPPKQKTLPLSKYRRKTANARERSRMREINEAFETLRRSIPLITTKCDSPNEKNTKISTLRLAMKYITVLSNALRDSDGDSDKDSIFSEYSITPADYRDSYTPTSLSDHSDFSDSFFSTGLSLEVTPSVQTFTTSSFLSENMFQNTLPRLKPTESTYKLNSVGAISERQSEFLSLNDSSSSASNSPQDYPVSRIPCIQEVTPVDSQTCTLLTPLDSDLRLTSLAPINLQLQSTPLDDWDDLNLSRVDFDELLST
ncbi:helix-loop-helix protein delilah-like [Macrosteles quadrilineatus]|uniref:helix-loop-helix protein delilah-like n=1 Tax=Macrosteles quadrilineatus TaxID=74068 RepID=UPI0023E2BCE8|nr:helix-loop-helix protein delilah-like [Macrosteles quadrilineatus]